MIGIVSVDFAASIDSNSDFAVIQPIHALSAAGRLNFFSYAAAKAFSSGGLFGFLYHHRLVYTPVAASGPTAQMSVSPIAISTNGILPFMPSSFHCLRNVERSPADSPPSTTSGFAWRIFRMNEL